MRNLTIKRTKSFVASLGKMKVYIEDPAGELLINQAPCRKLGELKNGEEKTFQIGEESARVFVIADKLTKNYCNDFFRLPEGQEDVYLTGKNRFSLSSGNAFRFDNNNSQEVALSRKKGGRVGLIVLLAAGIIGVTAGLLIGRGIVSATLDREQTFSSSGMSITLTGRFQESSAPNFTAAFESKNVAVLALREPFDMVPGFADYSLEEYGQLVLKANNKAVSTQTRDGLTFFHYDALNPQNGKTYRYVSYIYKAGDAFWMIQFATLASDADDYTEDIHRWAKSVQFSSGTIA